MFFKNIFKKYNLIFITQFINYIFIYYTIDFLLYFKYFKIILVLINTNILNKHCSKNNKEINK